MIAAKAIEYNTFTNRDFNLVVDVAFDSDNGESDSFLERDVIFTESYHGKLKRVHGYKYTNVFSPKFTLVKNDFSNITFQEQREILAWLTSKSTPSFLTVYSDYDGDTILFECLGAFIDVKPYKLANNRTVGFIATFESIFPWALSPLAIYELTTPNQNGFSIATAHIKAQYDDLDSPIYPRITITQNATSSVVAVDHELTEADELLPNTAYYYFYYNDDNDEIGTYYWLDSATNELTSSDSNPSLDTTSVQIINEHNNTRYITTVINNIKGETIVLDGANKIVFSSRSNGRTFGNDFSWNWLPLFNGDNNITVIGNCQVKLEFREPIKIGEW